MFQLKSAEVENTQVENRHLFAIHDTRYEYGRHGFSHLRIFGANKRSHDKLIRIGSQM